MPFGDWEDWDDCVDHMMDEEGYDKESAENICGALQEELKIDEGDPEGLLDNILNSAEAVITDMHLDLVSPVDVPAQPSDWFMMKSEKEGFDWQRWASESTVILKKDNPGILEKDDKEDVEEKRIAFAPALVPNITDKQGDVIPAHVVIDSAHKFIKDDGGIDADHDLVEGKGQVVESWTLKREQTFTLPNGKEKTYPPGTWMLGIQFEAKTWKRIKEGELQGLSIFGQSNSVSTKSIKTVLLECPNCQERVRATLDKVEKRKENNKHISGETDNKNDNMSEEELKEIKELMSEQTESLTEKVSALTEIVEDLTEKAEESEDEDKESEDKGVENLEEAIEFIQDSLPKELADEIVNAIQEDEDEDDEDEDDEEKGEPASKGHSTENVNEAKKNIASGDLQEKSFEEVARKEYTGEGD